MYRFFMISPIIFAAASLITGTTLASDICVKCDQPAVTYVCRPTAAPEHAIFLQNRRLTQLACIREIAQAYAHESCKASQHGAQVCSGKLVSIDLTRMAREYTNRLPKPLRPNDLSQAGTPPGTQNPQPQQGEPKTVVELAKRTVENSQDQLSNAGEKAGDAVKKVGKVVEDSAIKTWQCLSSLFLDC